MNSKSKLKSVYESRPFKTRNADEFDLAMILDLFVDPTEGLKSPFDFENSIIKGRMGSGKTMYLRANHAYYLYTLIPRLLDGDEIILPIYIKLSDFQTINSADKIYKAIIIKIIKEIANSYLFLQDSNYLTKLHKGMQSISDNLLESHSKINQVIIELSKLSSDEYTEYSSNAIRKEAGLAGKYVQLSAEYSDKVDMELKKTPNPGISEINTVYEKLLKPVGGKLLLLFDEVGSMDKSFFKENENVSSFEALMNQLRTLSYIRTKIAIYPQTFSDVLNETRYGDVILLQEDVKNNEGYEIYENRAISLIEKYVENACGFAWSVENIIDIDNDDMRNLEQLIYSSNGNMRRFVNLLDNSLNFSYKESKGMEKVLNHHIRGALIDHARVLESLFSASEIEFLDVLATTCKARGTFRFKFPNKSLDMLRYMTKSSEYNVVNLIEAGSGRKGSIYEFDYAYAVYKEIPTHYIFNSERIDKQRSKFTGKWITKITTINDGIIENSQIIGKIEGEINYINENAGFIIGEDEKRYFFQTANIIKEDKNKTIRIGTKVRFLPIIIEDNNFVQYIEIL